MKERRMVYALVIGAVVLLTLNAGAHARDCRVSYEHFASQGGKLVTTTKVIREGQQIRVNQPEVVAVKNLDNNQARFEFDPRGGVKNVTLRRNEQAPRGTKFNSKPTLLTVSCLGTANPTVAKKEAPAKQAVVAAEGAQADLSRRTLPRTRRDTRDASDPAQVPDAQQQIVALTQRVQALEADLTRLLNIIQIDGSDITIASVGELSLLADSNLEVRADGEMTVEASMDINVDAGLDLNLEGASRAGLFGTSNVLVKSGATLNLDGALVRKNSSQFPTVTDMNGAIITGTCPPAGGAIIAGKIVVGVSD